MLQENGRVGMPGGEHASERVASIRGFVFSRCIFFAASTVRIRGAELVNVLSWSLGFFVLLAKLNK